MPRLGFQERAFRKAKEAFEADGRTIYNASRFTKLDLFERVDFEGEQGLESRTGAPTRLDLPLYADIDVAVFSPSTKRILIRGWSSASPDRVDIFIGNRRLGSAEAGPSYSRRRMQMAWEVFNFSATIQARSVPSQAVCVVLDFGGVDQITISRRVDGPDFGEAKSWLRRHTKRFANALLRWVG